MMLIPLVAAVSLACFFAFATEASPIAKVVVLLLVVLSLYLQFGVRSQPAWIAAVLLQVVVSIGVLLYKKATE